MYKTVDTERKESSEDERKLQKFVSNGLAAVFTITVSFKVKNWCQIRNCIQAIF